MFLFYPVSKTLSHQCGGQALLNTVSSVKEPVLNATTHVKTFLGDRFPAKSQLGDQAIL